jgi:hypothetical protein
MAAPSEEKLIMYSRSAKGGEKGDPNRNPWLAKMVLQVLVPTKRMFTFTYRSFDYK